MKKNPFFWLVAIIGLILDQVTKYGVVISFPELGDSFPIWKGVFHFTYVHNTGAAFSFFQGGANWLKWLSLMVSFGLMVYAFCTPRLRMAEQLGYGFILAGALGNGIDRFLFGYVVDFLDFRLINFPVFNVADTCINFGIAFLLYASFIPIKSKNKPRNY
jgi:signal peptidase II